MKKLDEKTSGPTRVSSGGGQVSVGWADQNNGRESCLHRQVAEPEIEKLVESSKILKEFSGSSPRR